MSFFAEIFILLMTFGVICLLAAIGCRLIELFWMATYACFAPLMCPNRRREPWPAELCNILITVIIFIDNTLFKWCGLCSANITRKINRCKLKLKLCRINAVKKTNKFKIKPIIYDDVHVIVVNPYDKYQIATVSKEVNTMEV
tara:strand:+ start:3310 stop:3738 length:429 start_codon:yes stop_codon:yes gene_type:complete